MTKKVVFHETELNWLPHPQGVPGFEVKPLVEKPAIDTRILLARATPGSELGDHTHDTDDVFLVLDGSAKIHIDGYGTFDLKKGSVVHVPKMVVHRVFDVGEQGYVVLDIFVP